MVTTTRGEEEIITSRWRRFRHQNRKERIFVAGAGGGKETRV